MTLPILRILSYPDLTDPLIKQKNTFMLNKV